MEQSFMDFENKYGGKVFIVYSTDDKVRNENVYDAIRNEIERIKSMQS